MPSTPRNRIATVGAIVAVAAGALGLDAGSAQATTTHAGTTTAATATHSRAAVRLAGHPLRVDRSLGHQARTTVHLVRSGDTLSGLAQRYHTTVSAIRKANRLPGNRIVAGKNITIPPAAGPVDSSHRTGSSPARPRTTQHTARTVTVRSGDTLSGIAASHRVSVGALRRANPSLHGTAITPGQRLNLPQAGGQHHAASPDRPSRGHQGSGRKVGRTFAGRTYDKDVTRAAQTNMDTLANRQVPTRANMQRMVIATARANGLDPKLAQAIAYTESGFDMRAVSPANAVGVMQLIPSSADWVSKSVGRRLDPLNPQDNVLAGVLLLKANLDSAGGNVDQAVAGYYQGLGSVRSNGMYADTKGYVARVKAQMARF